MINIINMIRQMLKNDCIKNISNNDSEIVSYLKEKLEPLLIEIADRHSREVFELIDRGELEGWCWQTAETCLLFMNDTDYLQRGSIYLSEEQPDYEHSWICFKYKNREYVFDPCLDYLCTKAMWNICHKPKVQKSISAKEMKEYWLAKIQEPKQEVRGRYSIWGLIEKHLSPEMREYLRNSRCLEATNDITSPIYRGDIGYVAEVNDNSIDKLTAHYYYNA